MGTLAARKAREIVANCQRVLAIELLCACQALDLRAPLKPGPATSRALSTVRKHVSKMDYDRPLFEDIEKVYELISSREIVKTVEAAIGEL
jgi:histidine ammonia-lyase